MTRPQPRDDLRALDLSPAGTTARDVLLADQELLRDAGLATDAEVRLNAGAARTLDEAKAALANEEQAQPAVAAHLKTLREFLENVTRGIVR